MSSPLLRRLARIAITMLISLAVSAATVFLGIWQYGRHVERADALASYEAAEELAPAPVSTLIPLDATELPEGAEWRMVTATGTFMEGRPFVLRTRPIEGTAAWQYLAWLNTDDGRSLLVNLGWVGQPGPTADPQFPELNPRHHVTVTGIMRTWEPDDGKEPGMSVSRISPDQLPAPEMDPAPGYVMLRDVQDTNGPVDLRAGNQIPLPALTVGPHLAYAWQWWVFALLAPVAGVLLLRRDAADSDDGPPYDQLPSEEPAPTQDPTPTVASEKPAPVAKPARASALSRRRTRELSDEEIEDAL